MLTGLTECLFWSRGEVLIGNYDVEVVGMLVCPLSHFLL